MNSLEQKIDKLIVYQPDKIKEILLTLHEQDHLTVEKALHRADLGCHLDEEMMNDALATIVRYDGMRAPFWTMTEFKDLCIKYGISTLSEKYNDYDLNYLTQAYLADFKSLGKEPITFMNMSIDKLHDIDDPKASEFAYHNAKHRLCKRK